MEVESVSNASESAEKIRQRGKTTRTLLIIGVVLLVLSSPLWLCGGCATIGALLPDSDEDSSSSRVDSSDSEEDSDIPTEEGESIPDTYGIAEDVQLGDYVVQVASIEDPYVSTNEFYQPEEGFRYISVDVIYDNPSSSDTLDYNPYDWKLYDSDGYSYSHNWIGKEPMLSSGTLNPGGTARGWLTFEVPTTAANFKLQFTPSWWSSDNVEIQLY